jgi:HEAT repeat protein
VDALYRALSDTSAQVRLQAVHGLAARLGNTKAASVLVNAVDDEPEVEVQLAEIAALGKFATTDAVVKLRAAAEPDGRLFRRKNPAYRVAAIQALADARTPAAMTTLQSLANDRDKEVREAVARVMMPSSRSAETAGRA